MLLDILLDCVQMALVVLIVYLWIERRRKPGAEMPILLPRMFDFSSPILRSALLAVALPSVISLLNRVYYDVFFFGSPQNVADLLAMIFFYLMDVVSVLVGYMVVFLIIGKLNLKDEEAKRNVMEQISGGNL